MHDVWASPDKGVNLVDHQQARLERCLCGAIVEILPTQEGDEVRLEAGHWPWADLPADSRFVVHEGIANTALTAAR